MPNAEEIAQQQKRLAAYRRNLAHSLEKQAAQGGAAHARLEVLNDVRSARETITAIKSVLRRWGVIVDDHPDDEEDGLTVAAKPRVFISYKRDVMPDERLALAIADTLTPSCDVFIDQRMLVGEQWARRIELELRRTDYLITILSSHSVYSEMVIGEVETAHRIAQAENGRPMILPVRACYREPFVYPLCMYLNQLQWAFWEGDEDTPALVEALRGAISGGTLPADVRRGALLERQVGEQQPYPLPLPSAQPASVDLPEGTMDVGSHLYIERAADHLALDAIRRRGVTLTIKGPRQMGKSSLLARVIDQALQEGKRVAFLDFQLFGHLALNDPDRFFQQFCANLTDELDIDNVSEAFWEKNRALGSSKCCSRYMERVVLKELNAPLVLAMDEVETIFDTAFRSDFFGMLRSWHNNRGNRASSPLWRNLDLAFVTSTEPYQLIDNLNQSPFNVGLIIELSDFTPQQVAELNRRHGLILDRDAEQQLIGLLGGHPYLLRRALYLVATAATTVAELFHTASDDHGPFGDHLRHHLFRLNDKPDLIQGLRQILVNNLCSDEGVVYRLAGAGLVRREGRRVVPRCQLYAEYFLERLRG